MLLTALFTFGAGPVLQVNAYLHFLMIVWEKIEVLARRGSSNLVYITSFRYAKLICFSALTAVAQPV